MSHIVSENFIYAVRSEPLTAEQQARLIDSHEEMRRLLKLSTKLYRPQVWASFIENLHLEYEDDQRDQAREERALDELLANEIGKKLQGA